MAKAVVFVLLLLHISIDYAHDRHLLSEDTEHDNEFDLDDIATPFDNFTHLYDEGKYVNHSNHSGTGIWDCEEVETALHQVSKIRFELHEFDLNCTHTSHNETHVPDGVYIVLYCGFVLLVGCVLKYGQHRFHIPVPYTALLLLVGCVLEIAEVTAEETENPDIFGHLNLGMRQVRTIDPHMVLSLFIPGLIFESAFNTNYHIFLKEAQQATMLAGPGVLVNAILIGGVMHYFANAISAFGDIGSYEWSWSFAIMFGSIVSATDPVAVVSLLKELGASARLSTLIEAESLLNDGTAFVMFMVLQEYAASSEGTSFASMMTTFLQLALGGISFGILSGLILYYCLSNIYNDFEIEITFTLCMVYLFAWVGDFLFTVSGVLVIVFLGLWTSKNREAISPAVEESMRHFWEMIAFIANTLLFFITGQVIAFRIYSNSHIDWPTDLAILLVLYISCHISRALSIWQMHPVLKHIGYGCTFEDSCVMVYGGLRGAIGLALALIVDTNADFSDVNRDRVLFHVCGIVVLTLVINASTVKYLVRYLGLDKPPSDTAQLFKSSMHHLLKDIRDTLTKMKMDKHYQGANWSKVVLLQPQYSILYEEIFEGEEFDQPLEDMDASLSVGSDDDLIINQLAKLQSADRDLQERNAIEKRVIQVMKSSYWAQFEKGLISADAVNILVEASEDAMDDHDLSKLRRNLKKWFSVPGYIKFMHQSQYRWVKKCSEWLLFDNLSFAIEVAQGFVYASKSAIDFTNVLKEINHDNAVESNMMLDPFGEKKKNKHIESALDALNLVTTWIEETSSNVVRVYPEVHTAIQTLHASHSLLHHQKVKIDELLHKGFLDDAEYDRVVTCCDHKLNELFHTSYTSFLSKNSDDESILLQSPLFSELTKAEKKTVIEKAKVSNWFKKGEKIMQSGMFTDKLYVITRGTVNIIKSDDTSCDIIHSKTRGEVLDVYTFLQGHIHDFDFVVATEQCTGYWLDKETIHFLKESNIDFYESLWKYAASDVLRFYFSESTALPTSMLDGELDSKIFESPLSFFDPDNAYRSQIRVNRGFGVLLNGTVVHINDMSSQARAPAILPAVDEPYVAVELAVVLYLDLERTNYKAQPNLNPKLAKMMGIGGQSTINSFEEDYEDFSTENDDDDEIDLSHISEENDEKNSDMENEANMTAQEKMFLVGSGGIEEDMQKLDHLNSVSKSQQKRPSRPSAKLSRYRTERHVLPGGKKVKKSDFSMQLNRNTLPSTDLADQIEEKWTHLECFEVVKHILSKHEALFDHIKMFHINHLQQELIEQMMNDDSVEFDDAEDLDEDEPQNMHIAGALGIPRPGGIKVPAKSLHETLNAKNNMFARPSRATMNKKMSLPHLDVDAADMKHRPRKKKVQLPAAPSIITADQSYAKKHHPRGSGKHGGGQGSGRESKKTNHNKTESDQIITQLGWQETNHGQLALPSYTTELDVTKIDQILDPLN